RVSYARDLLYFPAAIFPSPACGRRGQREALIMRLLVTRPWHDAQILKPKLEQMGHEVIASPVLEIAPRSDIQIPNVPYQLIALTSANAIRCLAGHVLLDRLRHLPLIAVGPQSAAAARQAGFAAITDAGGDGVGLARHIIAHAS